MKVNIISASFIVFVFAATIVANKSVKFDITKNGQDMYICNSSDVTLSVSHNETIDVNVLGYTLHNPSCSLIGDNSSKILRPGNFQRVNQSLNLAQVKTDTLKSGRWNCTFLILKNINKGVLDSQLYYLDNDTYIRVYCTVRVNVAESANPVIDKNTLYYIIGACAIAVIVIGQFIAIIYLKRKTTSRNLRHLQDRQAPSLGRDNNRYSVGPGQRKNSRKNVEDDLYVTVDDLRQVPRSSSPLDIKNRPPMPLPMHNMDSDDDHIYKDGETLKKMFSPEPPPIATLPRNRGKKNERPKPAPKPIKSSAKKSPQIDMENYDYADNSELTSTDSLNRAPMKGKKPAPNVPKKPAQIIQEPPRLANAKPILPGGASLMSELSSKFENDLKIRNTASPKRPVTERANNAEASWQQSAGRVKAREITPPDARAARNFRPPLDPRPRPQESPLQKTTRPHAGPSVTRGPLRSTDNPQGHKGPPMSTICPIANVARLPNTATLPARRPAVITKPLPPTPLPTEPDELYEPIEDNQNSWSDDEEFQMEELEPYSMYMNSVSLLDRDRQH